MESSDTAARAPRPRLLSEVGSDLPDLPPNFDDPLGLMDVEWALLDHGACQPPESSFASLQSSVLEVASQPPPIVVPAVPLECVHRPLADSFVLPSPQPPPLDLRPYLSPALPAPSIQQPPCPVPIAPAPPAPIGYLHSSPVAFQRPPIHLPPSASPRAAQPPQQQLPPGPIRTMDVPEGGCRKHFKAAREKMRRVDIQDRFNALGTMLGCGPADKMVVLEHSIAHILSLREQNATLKRDADTCRAENAALVALVRRLVPGAHPCDPLALLSSPPLSDAQPADPAAVAVAGQPPAPERRQDGELVLHPPVA